MSVVVLLLAITVAALAASVFTMQVQLRRLDALSADLTRAPNSLGRSPHGNKDRY